jgi:hypothetical protein
MVYRAEIWKIDAIQIELIKDFRSRRDSFSTPQVIGNVEKTIIT